MSSILTELSGAQRGEIKEQLQTEPKFPSQTIVTSSRFDRVKRDPYLVSFCT